MWALSSQQEAEFPKQPIIVILCSSDCMRNKEELDSGLPGATHCDGLGLTAERGLLQQKEGRGEVLLIDEWRNIC